MKARRTRVGLSLKNHWMIVQFEQAIQDVVKKDAELSTFCTLYQEARKRFQERAKARGF